MTKITRVMRWSIGNYILELEPIMGHPALIRIKEKRRRIWFETSLEAVFHMAVKQAMNGRKEKK